MSLFENSPESDALLKQIGSANLRESVKATYMLAKAIETPLRKGVLSGDILSDIFEPVNIQMGSPMFPLDLLSPGTEKEHVAYTIPGHGRIAEKTVESDYVMVNSYKIGNSIDWLLEYAENARWDVVGRAIEVFEAGFVKKLNDDGWNTILSAAVDRNIVVYDNDAAAGQFTKRLVSLMKTVMRRNGGGNSTSINRGKLTDLYMSPECMEDIRNWGVDQIDEVTRREIYISDGTVSRIFGVLLHDLDELGENQEYQDFYLDQLGASLAASDVELLIGLDRSKKDSFVMPVTKPLQVFNDDANLHRQQRAGIYGWMNAGFGVLDGRRVIAASC